MKPIPVYLFLGFLESGKSTFIQGTLEDPRFNDGESTLLLLCEEGEVEPDSSKYPSQNVFCEVLTRKEQLNPDKLYALSKKHNAERVICEYNGMWQVNDLFNAFPENWQLAQCITFFDFSTVNVYNTTMRSLVVDKLTYCDLAVFNRLPVGEDTEFLHKLVRGVSRRSDIAYEFTDGTSVYDDTEDPLPFDKEEAFINIEDRDYALWYRDLSENTADYDRRTVRFTGIVAADAKMPAGSFFAGRHVMTCCEDDIAYNGLLCVADTALLKEKAIKLKSYDWVKVTGEIKIEKSKFYRGAGPVLHVTEITETEKPEQPVATFY